MSLAIRSLIGAIAALVLTVAVGVVPASAASTTRDAAPASAVKAGTPLGPIPVSGRTSDGGTMTGTLVPTGFAQKDGNLVLNGTLSGVLTDASGTTHTISATPTALPVQLPGTCPILHLTLGPLDLNLLGLTVHLNRVVLDLTAISGPGNLLGNLLCAIAGLLNGGGSLSQLNQLIAQLNQRLGLSA